MLQKKSKRPEKTGGNSIIKKNFLGDKLITDAAKRCKISASKLSYTFKTFIKVGKRDPAAN